MAVRIVLADDDEAFCECLASFIRSVTDFELCGIAHDGCETLGMVERHRPDILLLDLVMPRLDGLAVLEKMPRQGRPTVIVVTAFTNDRVLGLAVWLGAALCLSKPVALPDLAQRIRRLVGGAQPALEAAVRRILGGMGIPAHYKGYGYLCDAILMTVEAGVTGWAPRGLYERVAKKHGTTVKQVQGDIYRTIRLGWSRRAAEVLGRDNVPTSMRFVAAVADIVRGGKWGGQEDGNWERAFDGGFFVSVERAEQKRQGR